MIPAPPLPLSPPAPPRRHHRIRYPAIGFVAALIVGAGINSARLADRADETRHDQAAAVTAPYDGAASVAADWYIVNLDPDDLATICDALADGTITYTEGLTAWMEGWNPAAWPTDVYGAHVYRYLIGRACS